MSIVARNVTAASRFVRQGAKRSAIILDLDDTVLWRSRGVFDLFLLYANPFPVGSVGIPYTYAIEAIQALSERYDIAAVTSRSGGAAAHTDRWLHSVGLAGMPLIHAAGPHPGDGSRDAFKAAAIRHLRAVGGLDPVIGIGDRPSDGRAYRAEGLHSLIVAHGQVTSVLGGGVRGSAAQRARKACTATPGPTELPKPLQAGRGGALRPFTPVIGDGNVCARSVRHQPATLLFTDEPQCFRWAAVAMTLLPRSDNGAGSSLSAGPALVARAPLSGLVNPLSLHVPLPSSGSWTSASEQSQPTATTLIEQLADKLPPIWAQLRAFLLADDALQVLDALASSSQSQGAAAHGGHDWEEEASAEAFVRGTPRSTLRPGAA